MSEFKPSPYQVAIRDTYKYKDCNMLVGAVAGSGKTTTLLDLMNIATGKITFLAFNKSIVNELSERVPNSVDVMTMHSMGMKAIIRKHGRVKVNAYKTGVFIKQNLNTEGFWDVPKKGKEQLFMILPRLVDIYRLTLCENMEELRQVADNIGIEYKGKHLEYAMDIIHQLEKYNKNPKEIDFTDMVHLPATGDGYMFPKSDVWFIDECQDLSPVQHLLFKKAKRRSRFVAVGDPYQAIYGFAGADSKSFDRFLDYPNTEKMPLSICYRCPQKVALHANGVYDIIEYPEWKEMGEVRNGEVQEASGTDMIICRNLKPLIAAFFVLIAEGKKCYIKGKDIGEALIRLVKPYKDRDVEGLLAALQQDLQEVEGELIEKGVQNPRRHPRWLNLEEKISAIRIILHTYNTPQKLLTALETMFGDEGSGIVLSSIHKSKGLEADNVFLLNSHLIPSQYANTEEQLKQENNLLYVAITRAKKKLIYCYIII